MCPNGSVKRPPRGVTRARGSHLRRGRVRVRAPRRKEGRPGSEIKKTFQVLFPPPSNYATWKWNIMEHGPMHTHARLFSSTKRGLGYTSAATWVQETAVPRGSTVAAGGVLDLQNSANDRRSARERRYCRRHRRLEGGGASSRQTLTIGRLRSKSCLYLRNPFGHQMPQVWIWMVLMDRGF